VGANDCKCSQDHGLTCLPKHGLYVEAINVENEVENFDNFGGPDVLYIIKYKILYFFSFKFDVSIMTV
jgi:hypothetical protein